MSAKWCPARASSFTSPASARAPSAPIPSSPSTPLIPETPPSRSKPAILSPSPSLSTKSNPINFSKIHHSSASAASPSFLSLKPNINIWQATDFPNPRMMRGEVPRLKHMKTSIFVFFLFVAAPLFAQQPPEIHYHSVPNFLKLPSDLYLGEAPGVAVNSKGH